MRDTANAGQTGGGNNLSEAGQHETPALSMREQEHGLARERTAVRAVFSLNGALFGVWASRIPAIAQKHQLEHGALGLVLLVIAFGAIVSFAQAGRFADRYGAQRTSRLLAAISALALVLMALAPNVYTLSLCALLFGAALGALDVAMNCWAGEAERRSGRSAMASFHAMYSLGAGLGAASGFVAGSAAIGVLSHFLLAAVLFGASALYLSATGPRAAAPASPDRPADRAGPVFDLPKGALLAAALAAFCSAVNEGAMVDWSALYLMAEAGVGEGAAALGFATFSGAMVLMRLLGDRVIDRHGGAKAARLAGAVAATGILIAVGFATYPMALLGFFLMGLGNALIFPIALTRAANDPVLPPGRAIAAVSTLGYGGFLLGPPVIGFLSEATSLRLALAPLALLALMILLIAGGLEHSDGGVAQRD